MHARNPYRTPPDFLALAEAYPPLKPHIVLARNGPIIDFKNETAQRLLTEAILLRDFSLKVELPPGRLCPPVPNRLNYILWLEDVVATTTLALELSGDRAVRGLDVGTGASAIYPLLGCRTNPTWSFTATELDELSLRFARQNVEGNNLQQRISVLSAGPSGPILAMLKDSDVVYDFTMCNPPFYSSREEVLQSAEAKEFEPNAVCTGADVEMITPGGEAAFVGRMVEESLELRDKCRWFTSMLGKMSSLASIVHLLRSKQVDNYAISELVQGQTRRWVIAWSFGDVRLPDPISRLSHSGIQHIMPSRNTLHQPLPDAQPGTEVATLLKSVLDSLAGLSLRQVNIDGSSTEVEHLASAARNTWSRAARRKKQETMYVDEHGEAGPKLVCRVCYQEASDAGKSTRAGQLVFHWLRGRDRGLFESFASHIERKVIAAVSAK
ncbi:S-adenosyl-L-methionine dependent methyltransferase [Trametes coccinea BRFM310]|uniref:S-adenosyl-L-methionine dependent methyltransferase n=1 Tax=Trametes coccinea (strain BRFM310) TaxID=1353009 RepID=A0A1Y2IGC1_TRAC3|nr:S-adenosyl-L-methionine dependent methyltransferase [Trametes coccinea BRFM310]